MATHHGHAFIQGVSSSGATVTVGGYAAAFVGSAPITHTSRYTAKVGSDGKTGALQWDDEKFTMTLSFMPASTSSIAAANAKAIFIAKGATVTLANFIPVKYPSAAGTDILNGDWINTGDATLTLNAETEGAEVSLSLERWANSTQNTLLKTAVS